MDPRFRFFYDLVRIVNFFQREQATPVVYVLENTFPGERCTPAVQKANDLVQSFLGAPILIDAADLNRLHIECDSFGQTCSNQPFCKPFYLSCYSPPLHCHQF